METQKGNCPLIAVITFLYIPSMNNMLGILLSHWGFVPENGIMAVGDKGAGTKPRLAIRCQRPRELDGPKYLQPVYLTINLFFHIVMATGLFKLIDQIK